MIVAHPDDEVIFGFHDIIYNDVLVICMTNGDNKIRKEEFFKSMQLCGSKGHILNYPDSPENTWSNLADEDIYNSHLCPLIRKDLGYELIVSHGSDGEYGNKQHIRTGLLGRYVASKMSLPFKTFRERYRASDYATHLTKYNDLIANYASQNIARNLSLINFFSHKKVKVGSKNNKVIEGQVPDLRLLLTNKYKY